MNLDHYSDQNFNFPKQINKANKQKKESITKNWIIFLRVSAVSGRQKPSSHNE